MQLLKRKLARWLEFITLELVIATVLFLLAVLLFSFIANEAVTEKEIAADRNIFNAVAPYISPGNTKAALFITFLGSGYFLAPVYLFIIGLFIRRRNYYYAIMVAVIALVSLLSGSV